MRPLDPYTMDSWMKLCTVRALCDMMDTNGQGPPGTPLIAYKVSNGLNTLTHKKHLFLAKEICHSVVIKPPLNTLDTCSEEKGRNVWDE